MSNALQVIHAATLHNWRVCDVGCIRFQIRVELLRLHHHLLHLLREAAVLRLALLVDDACRKQAILLSVPHNSRAGEVREGPQVGLEISQHPLKRDIQLRERTQKKGPLILSQTGKRQPSMSLLHTHHHMF